MIEIPSAIFQDIRKQAENEYPRECCGLVLADPKKLSQIRVIPIPNVQDMFHEQDPQHFPRSSRTAYMMDPQTLLEIHKEIRQTGEILQLIYHSHIDAPAVFSDEDKRQALWESQPVYFGVSYLILSIVKGVFCEAKLYAWDENQKEYLPQTF